jgi:hypothetical protein
MNIDVPGGRADMKNEVERKEVIKATKVELDL